jgi:transcription antitermination protein NusB
VTIVSRRIAREKALQSLFQIDLANVNTKQAVQYVLEEEPHMVDAGYVTRLVDGTIAFKSNIDEVLSRYSIGWELSRMANVDRNILRLATYELLYETDIPPNVVVNEAVELAKAFSTYESGKFVNGILGKMIHDLDRLRTQATAHPADDVE